MESDIERQHGLALCPWPSSTQTYTTTLDQSKPGSGGKEGVSTFPKAPALQEPHHQIVRCYIQDTRLRGVSYACADVQSVYSTAPADWAVVRLRKARNYIKKSVDLLFELVKNVFLTFKKGKDFKIYFGVWPLKYFVAS